MKWGFVSLVRKFAIIFSVIVGALLLYLVGTYGFVKYQLYAVKKDTHEYLINKEIMVKMIFIR